MVVPKTSVPLLQPASDLSLIRPRGHTGWLSGAVMPQPGKFWGGRSPQTRQKRSHLVS
jgi:hypothetical protein